MFFNSIHYVVFLPIVVIGYFLTPPKFRWPILLAASYYFYMCWKPEYVILIMASTLIDYYAGRKIDEHTDQKIKKRFLLFSLISNLGILFSFKYFTFFSETTRDLLSALNIFHGVPVYEILLPVGISFYTFQSMSYTIDVYRGHMKSEKHLGRLALYVSFFPQLVAGPIERSTTLIPQLQQTPKWEDARVISGLRLIMWGFFKKIVIADRLAPYVELAFKQPGEYDGNTLIVATYFFAIQVYCDFSGYSDIAIGSARILGIKLMSNFKTPYLSTSIAEFWKRWHISLSTWIRDYLYMPLYKAFGFRNKHSRSLALLISFSLNGLWHGAGWRFIAWGTLHGIYLIVSNWTEPFRSKCAEATRLSLYPKLHFCFKVFVTFHLVLLGYIIFRSPNLESAWIFLQRVPMINFSELGINLAIGPHEVILALMFIMILAMVDIVAYRKPDMNLDQFYGSLVMPLRWFIYLFLTLSVILLGYHNKTVEFIYFQF